MNAFLLFFTKCSGAPGSISFTLSSFCVIRCDESVNCKNGGLFEEIADDLFKILWIHLVFNETKLVYIIYKLSCTLHVDLYHSHLSCWSIWSDDVSVFKYKLTQPRLVWHWINKIWSLLPFLSRCKIRKKIKTQQIWKVMI